jgi:sodium transport system permease protein
MNTFWTVFKKEWLVVFRDRRSLIINIVSFGIGFPLLMCLPYVILASSLFTEANRSLDVAVSGLEYAPELVDFIESKDDNLVHLVPVSDVEAAIRNQDYSVGLVIPPDFAAHLTSYQTADIEVVSQHGRVLDTASIRVSTLLDSFSDELLARRMQEKNLPKDFMRPLSVGTHEIVTESRFQRSSASWSVVLLLTMYGFMIGMSKAIAITAGEKEQLTMEVLLLSPANRAGIVLGKTAFVLTYGFAIIFGMFFSAIVMVAGGMLILAQYVDLSKIFSTASSVEGTATAPMPEFAQATLAGLLVILLLTLVCTIIFTIIQIIAGLWARSESQASTILIGVNFLPGLTSLIFLSDTYNPALWHYAIPLLGQILLIPDLLVNRWDVAALLICLMSSIATICLLSLAAVWLLRQEVIISRT